MFDNSKRTLDMKVISRDKETAQAGCSTTNLSGGERSYVTVALLMSLWSCVEHPFYFLDEYDVFTVNGNYFSHDKRTILLPFLLQDSVNRNYITRMLLGEAKKHPHLQYTFLTPQDISGIEPSDSLTILRLANPER